MLKIRKELIIYLIITLSALISLLMVGTGSFPYLGIGLSLILFSTTVYLFKVEKSKLNLVLYILTVILSFFIFFRANGFLIFLDIVTIFYLGSFMSLPKEYSNNLNFINFLLLPFLLFFNSLITKNIYPLKTNILPKSKPDLNVNNISEIIKSLLITLLILVITLPLLASANPYFSKLIENITQLFNIDKILKYIFSDQLLIWFLRLFIVVLLTFFTTRFLSLINTNKDGAKNIPNVFHLFHLLLPKIILAFVLMVFFYTQAQLYFSTEESLKALGYSHSQYAREIFAQLSVVGLVIFGLIYNDKLKSRWSKVTTYLLISEGLFLTFIALKSVYDYSYNWGFTEKRLWGYTVVFWLLGVFIFYLYKYFKDFKDTIFIKGVIFFSAIILIGVNIVSFDYLIFHYRKTSVAQGTDYIYLSNLSTDASSYREQIHLLNEEINNNKNNQEKQTMLSVSAYMLLTQIENLQNKYRSSDFRNFNISEFRQFKDIENIDTKKYYNDWELYKQVDQSGNTVNPSQPVNTTQQTTN